MKWIPLLMLTMATGSGAAGELPDIGHLVLRNGREYQQVKVTGKRPDGISIMHASGTARLAYEDLPEAVVRSLGGFDPVEAAKARRDDRRKQAAAEAEMEILAADAQLAANQRRLDKSEWESSSPAILYVAHPAKGGALCHISFIWDQKTGCPEKDAFGRTVIRYKMEKVIGEPTPELHFVSGIDEADGSQLAANIAVEGNYSYTTAIGVPAKVKKWKLVADPALKN